MVWMMRFSSFTSILLVASWHICLVGCFTLPPSSRYGVILRKANEFRIRTIPSDDVVETMASQADNNIAANQGSSSGEVKDNMPEYDEDIMPVAQMIEECEGKKVAAVYGVLDIAGQVKFVGLTKNLAASLQTHQDQLEQRLVHTACATTFRTPNKEEMEFVRKSWIKELGYTPVGNTKLGRAQWAPPPGGATTAAAAAAVAVAAGEQQEDPASEAVIDASPFAEDNTEQKEESFVPPEVKQSECKNLDLTPENVDKVLEEVRPYLISDGGNIKVVGVDTDRRAIQVALQGACGSCPSSTVTMQMGVERVLRENFAGLQPVEVVEDPDLSTENKELTVELVDGILDQIRPAIRAMGGSLAVASARDGRVELDYQGPDKIRFGVELTLKDNELINEVVFL